MRTAGSLMTENLITVSPLLSTQELALLFEARRISGAPVVDDDGTILGVVTKADLSRAHAETMPCEGEDVPGSWYHPAAAPGFAAEMMRVDTGGLCKSNGPSPQDAPPEVGSVKAVMNRAVFTIEADRSLQEVAREMMAHRIHRLLVTRNGRLAGIVTSTDLIRAMAEA